MKKLFVAAILAAWVPTMAYAAPAKLRFGIDPTFAPFESVNPQGELVGIDVDMGKSICKRIEADCEWIRMNFDGVIPALKAKKIDAILSGMTITKEREKQVLFSDVMYASSTRLMVPANSEGMDTTAESLKGKTIGVVQGTTQAAYADKHWKGKGIDLVSYQNDDLAKQDLALGRVDATLQDAAAATIFFESADGKNFKLVGTPVSDAEVFGNGNGIGLRKEDTELKGKIDKALADMKQDGEYAKILETYKKYGIKEHE